MSYPQNLMKLSWGGTILQDDVWTNAIHVYARGFSGGATASETPTPVAADRDNYFDNVNLQTIYNLLKTAYANGTGANMASYNSLDWVKLVKIGTDGKYDGEAKVYAPAGGTAGTNPNSGRSPQDSLVVTLDTGARTGNARKGRIYPPAGFVPVNGQGVIDSSLVDAYATRFSTLIKALRDYKPVDNVGAWAVVASGIGSGIFREVLQVRVGNILDTQRRRRNRLSEVYVTKPVFGN